MGTGSDWKDGGHVIWGGKPLTRTEKGDRGLDMLGQMGLRRSI